MPSRRTSPLAAPAVRSFERRPGSRSGCGRSSTDGGFGAFTDTFEDLGQLKQLPGIAVQRLMADGYGFGAEGDWKTAVLVRLLKVMATGLPGGTSFMEDYTYDLDPAGPRVLGAHMLEVCPSLAAGRPSCEIHPLSIGGRSDPVRLVFDAAPGPAVVAGLTDMGDRFRIVANVVDVVEAEEALPRLPVARAVWRPRPDFRTTVEAWLTAGGRAPHGPEPGARPRAAHRLRGDGRHRAHPDRRDVDPPRRQERDPLEPGLLPPGPRRLGCSDEPDGSAALRETVWRANQSLVEAGLVSGAFGNASGIDRAHGIILIKPSGVPYAELRPEHLVAVAIDDGRVVDGDLRPSSDTPTHLALYRRFPDIGGVVHTHSPEATAWAQACRPIPPFGTTHADHFRGAVPVTRQLQDAEVAGEYEHETGMVIVEALEVGGLDPADMPAVLVAWHGPFTWGADAQRPRTTRSPSSWWRAWPGERWPSTRTRNRCPRPCSSATSGASTGRPPTTASGRDDRVATAPWLPASMAQATSGSAPSRSPSAAPDEVLMRVTSVGLCGSDLHWYREGAIGDAGLAGPLVLGHEFSGVIVDGPRAGERVVADPADPVRDVRAMPDGWRARVPRRPVCRVQPDRWRAPIADAMARPACSIDCPMPSGTTKRPCSNRSASRCTRSASGRSPAAGAPGSMAAGRSVCS